MLQTLVFNKVQYKCKIIQRKKTVNHKNTQAITYINSVSFSQSWNCRSKTKWHGKI